MDIFTCFFKLHPNAKRLEVVVLASIKRVFQNLKREGLLPALITC